MQSDGISAALWKKTGQEAEEDVLSCGRSVPGPRRAQFDYFQSPVNPYVGVTVPAVEYDRCPTSHTVALRTGAIATAGWMRFYQALERELADIAEGCEPPA